MQKRIGIVLSVFSAATCALVLMAPGCALAATPQTPTQPQIVSNAVANGPARFDISPPLTSMLATAPAQKISYKTHAPLKTKQQAAGAHASQAVNGASAFHPAAGSRVSATTGLGFEGVGQVGGFYSPPEGLNCAALSGGALAPARY